NNFMLDLLGGLWIIAG
ncbi:YGGT family protein, partial [Haemophilus influenzae]